VGNRIVANFKVTKMKSQVRDRILIEIRTRLLV